MPNTPEFEAILKKADLGDASAQAEVSGRYRVGYGTDKNLPVSLEWAKKSAAAGSPTGLCGLGIMHQQGLGGLAIDTQQAKTLFDRALAAAAKDKTMQANPSWLSYMGLMHHFGYGLVQNDAEAVKYYIQAAEKGVPWAQYALGTFCEAGRGGLPKDAVKAVSWFTKSANQGYPFGEFNLGRMYGYGLGGLPHSEAEAVKFYRRAAERGNQWAQESLAYMYENALGGLTKDLPLAATWYRRAAEQGLPGAQNKIGWWYKKGLGVSKDEAQAAVWFRKAADQGNVTALYNLAYMYANAEGGLRKDNKQAAECYRKAAEKGHAAAQFQMGVIYKEGKGVSKDEKQAVVWYRKAAAQGDLDAINNLAVMYKKGEGGLAKDLFTAAVLYCRAAKKGHQLAQKNLNECLAGLPIADRAQVERTATEQETAERQEKHADERLQHAESVARAQTELLAAQQRLLATKQAAAEQEMKLAAQKAASPAPAPTPPVANQFGSMQISFTIPAKELTLGEKIGQGGFGVVYKGTLHGHIPVAVKQLHTQLGPKQQQDFRQEAEAMAKFRSPQVVQFYGVCIEKVPYMLVMEYMPNGSLFSVLQSSQVLDWSLRQRMAWEGASGLDYLHRAGTLHRDVKALNALVDGEWHIKLTDFGLATAKDEVAKASSANNAAGTLLWMAPELLAEDDNVRCSVKTDVYSYGVMVWEIAARKIPFQGVKAAVATVRISQGTRETIPADCPLPLKTVITRCWDGDPAKRPTLTEVITSLKNDNPVITPAISGSTANLASQQQSGPASGYKGNLDSQQAGSASGYKGNLASQAASKPAPAPAPSYQGNLASTKPT